MRPEPKAGGPFSCAAPISPLPQSARETNEDVRHECARPVAPKKRPGCQSFGLGRLFPLRRKTRRAIHPARNDHARAASEFAHVGHRRSMSWSNLQQPHSADLHVAHAVIDDWILSRVRHDRVKNDALTWGNGIDGHPGERMVRIGIGIDRCEHSANDVKRAVKIRSRIDEIESHALANFRLKWVILVLKGDAIEYDFVRSDSDHLVIIAGHELAFYLLGVPFALHQNVADIGRGKRLERVDYDCSI